MSRLKPGELKYNWEHQLRLYLLEAGTTGRKQGEITKKFARTPPEEVIMQLETWWAQELVQRFTTPTHGPKVVVWRATDELNV